MNGLNYWNKFINCTDYKVQFFTTSAFQEVTNSQSNKSHVYWMILLSTFSLCLFQIREIEFCLVMCLLFSVRWTVHCYLCVLEFRVLCRSGDFSIFSFCEINDYRWWMNIVWWSDRRKETGKMSIVSVEFNQFMSNWRSNGQFETYACHEYPRLYSWFYNGHYNIFLNVVSRAKIQVCAMINRVHSTHCQWHRRVLYEDYTLDSVYFTVIIASLSFFVERLLSHYYYYHGYYYYLPRFQQVLFVARAPREYTFSEFF